MVLVRKQVARWILLLRRRKRGQIRNLFKFELVQEKEGTATLGMRSISSQT